MKNLHIIATDKPSRLWFYKQTDILLTGLTVEKSKDIDTQNLYITNDEKIKEGDWCYDKVLNIVFQTDKHTNFAYINLITNNVLKIIITTDIDLIKDGVQSIDDEFLEWFVKNPSCEEVEVKEKQHFEADKSKRKNPLNGVYYSYKIIIPKEEQKELRRKLFTLIKSLEEEDKKETLEEVSERILANNIDGLRDALKDDDLFYFYKGVIQSYGEAMAKWQQEQDKDKFSEEQVLEMIKLRLKFFGIATTDSENLKWFKWFNQFKKNEIFKKK